MYTCSVTALIQTGKSASDSSVDKPPEVWRKTATPPVTNAPYLSILGQLLVVGGSDLDSGKPTTAIHMYSSITDSWKVISHMTIPRQRCIASVLPNNYQLMVVGGETDSVELGDKIIKI